MVAPPHRSGIMSFSDTDVPARESLAIWSRMLNKWLLDADVTGIGDAPFKVSVKLRALPQIRFGWGSIGASLYDRPRSVVARDNDDLMLFMNLGGRFFVRHG